MRTQGSPDELERRRRLAVQRVLEGYAADEVADFLDVSPRTVWRWLALYRGEGPERLVARPAPDRGTRSDAATGPEERHPREGLGRGGAVGLAGPGSPGAVLPDVGQRLLRHLVFGLVPRGPAEGVDRAGGRRLGRRQHAQGG